MRASSTRPGFATCSLRPAIAGLFRARWTERILDECFANLSADRPDIPPEPLRRTRRVMAVATADAVITDYDHLIDQLDLSDADDRHVLGAAIAAGRTCSPPTSLTSLALRFREVSPCRRLMTSSSASYRPTSTQ